MKVTVGQSLPELVRKVVTLHPGDRIDLEIITNPSMPLDEVRLVSGNRVVGRIVNLATPEK